MPDTDQNHTNHYSPQTERVAELLRLLLTRQNEAVRTLWTRSEALLSDLQPLHVFEAFDSLLAEGHSAQALMPIVDKAVNLVRDYLDTDYAENATLPLWLSKLESNNDTILHSLSELRKDLVDRVPEDDLKQQVNATVRTLQETLDHYSFKENLLFPLLEQRRPAFRGLQLMWGKQDEARVALRSLAAQSETANPKERAEKLGTLFFRWQGLVEKERVILFPAALSVLTNDDHEALNDAVRGNEAELLGDYSEEADQADRSVIGLIPSGPNHVFKIPSGEVSLKSLLILLNHVPGELTWVDENDKVKFYSEGGKQIFPRTPQVIGRDVRQCHPPASVDIVEEIIASFRSGAKDHAKFWIRRGDMLILIRYIAVRDEDGQYRGVLEYTEEISELQNLEGERRLLDWEN